MMLDGTPDDAALDSVLLPSPKVPQKKPKATPPRPYASVEAPAEGDGQRRAVDLDLAADLNFAPPRGDLQEGLADVPEAVTFSAPAAGDELDDVPEAAPLHAGDLPLVPDVGPLCGPSPLPGSPPVVEELKPGVADQAPADIAADMGFATVDAVGEPEGDEPGGGHTREQELSGWAAMARTPLPQAWILIFGIICGIVAVVGMIGTKC